MDNGKTQFTVGRTSPTGSYTVKYNSNDDADMKPLAELRRQLRDAPYRPSALGDFERYLDSPYFSIERAQSVRGTGGVVVSPLVHYRPPSEKDLHIDGRVYFDESLGMVVRHYELEHAMVLPQGRAVALYEATVEYRQENRKAVQTRVDLMTHPLPPTVRSTRWEYEISTYSLGCSTLPEEFTPAHYGLGNFERTAAQAEAPSNYRRVAIASAAFLAAAVLLGIGRKIHKYRALADRDNKPAGPPGATPDEQTS